MYPFSILEQLMVVYLFALWNAICADAAGTSSYNQVYSGVVWVYERCGINNKYKNQLV
jgi:hypothetical protein